MFDLNFTELLVVALVAIVVVGPKELPQLMRTVGNWVGKVKRMGRDFQRQLNEAVRDEELQALQKQMTDLSKSTDADIRRGLTIPNRYLPGADAPKTRAAALERAASLELAAPPAPAVPAAPGSPAADVPAENKVAVGGAKP